MTDDGMVAKAAHQPGESFPIQFVWKLPNDDYIRAVFRAEVVSLVEPAEKYFLRLSELMAGRQETAVGEIRPKEALTRPFWALVGRLIGRKVLVAYEAEDGRPLHMRLATLTGEHDFFFRYDD